MISRHEMILSVMSYERNNIIFYTKILNIRKILLLIMCIVIEFVITIASQEFSKNY